MLKQTIIALSAAALAGACVPGGGFLPGPQYASGQTIFNAVTNFSVVGSHADGTSYCDYHAPNGALTGRGATGGYNGSWSVNGDQLCYSKPGFGGCQNVIFEGQRVTFYDPAGQAIGGGNLIGGNVC